MGTRFVASEEAAQPPWMKEQVAAASSDDTVLTKICDLVNDSPFPVDIGDRVLRNDFTAAWHGREVELVCQQAEALDQLRNAPRDHQPRVVANRAGSAAGQIRSVEAVAMIVTTIVDQATRIIEQRPRQLLSPPGST